MRDDFPSRETPRVFSSLTGGNATHLCKTPHRPDASRVPVRRSSRGPPPPDPVEAHTERGMNVGTQASKVKGKVKWFNTNRGFGFITVEGGRDVFVHYTAVNAPGRPRLREGQTVELEIVQDKKGPRAANVVPLD